MLVKEAQPIVRAAKGNTKMNCGCWGLPTSTCAKNHPGNPDSTCNPKNCYAQRGQYHFPNVVEAQKVRLQNTTRKDFTLALTTILNREKYFRFFDSGDFGNAEIMRKIMKACELAPFTKIHIPTKQYALIEWYKKIWPIPENVIIRAGMWKIDANPDEVVKFLDRFDTIAIVSREAWVYPYVINGTKAYVCPAARNNPSGPVQCIIDCDWCWHSENKVVVFPWH